MRFVLFVSFLMLFAEAFASDFEKINKVSGISLFGNTSLWEDTPAIMESRFGIAFKHTKTKAGGSMSAYVKNKIFGANAHEFCAEYSDGKISSVKIVFFNKGDSVEKWTSSTGAKMRADVSAISDSITANFGKYILSKFDEGMDMRGRQWKYADSLFTLFYKEKEFVILKITPASPADSDKNEDTPKITLDLLKKNIKKNQNSDITVSVPMVNQGQKGYCFPATVERVLRYYGIEGIDMHKLAQMFNTGVGGRTYTSEAVDDIEKIGRKYFLKLETSGFDFNKIVKNIDSGVPIMWQLVVCNEYISGRASRTIKRCETSNFDEWKKFCRKEKKFKAKKFSRDSGHICLIVGYNKNTKEIAISDSWGDNDNTYCWLSFDMTKAVSQSVAFLILRPRN